jgi:hypothetical protein
VPDLEWPSADGFGPPHGPIRRKPDLVCEGDGSQDDTILADKRACVGGASPLDLPILEVNPTLFSFDANQKLDRHQGGMVSARAAFPDGTSR